ncbi:MAG: hypothetical protein LBH58_03900 [Tannerellaceae bacterium]|jgi:sedoheptulokinase|nr:hypothetical protein [Tannerellaceae bacterium]
MKTKSHLIGIDFGTTSLSVSFVDAGDKQIKKVISRNTNAYIPSENPLVREQSVEVLTESFKNVLDEINFLPGVKIEAYGFTGQMHGIVGLGKNGEAITNLVTWEDRSGEMILDDGSKMIDKIKTLSGNDSISCGYGIITLYKWLVLEGRKDIFGFCSIADYFAGLLSGKIAMSPTMAHSVGLFDMTSNTWNRESIEKLGIDFRIFPEIVDESSIIGYANDIPVVSAIGDNQASFLGIVSGKETGMVLNIGTGTQISVLIDQKEIALYDKYIDGAMTQLRPYDGNYYLMATSFVNGGSSYRSLFNFMKATAENLFGLNNIDENTLWENMEKAACDSFEKGDLPDVCPLLSNERIDHGMKGAITGITLHNFHPGNLIAGFLKGLAYYYKSALNPQILQKAEFIYGSGNGLKKNKLFARITEQVFGKPLRLTQYDEEAAFGAAMNAARALMDSKK